MNGRRSTTGAGEDLAGFGGGEVADAGADVEGENAGACPSERAPTPVNKFAGDPGAPTPVNKFTGDPGARRGPRTLGRTLDADGFGDVVGDAGADGDDGDGELDLGAGLVEGGGGDVDGLVEDVRLLPREGAEEDSGFGGGAGAELGDGEWGVASC